MIITIVCTVISGLTGFIAGMAVEFNALTKALKETRTDLKNTQRKLAVAESRLKKDRVEVIEINDNRIKTDNLFEPW